MVNNENAQERIDRLNREIQSAQATQNSCRHDWTDGKYDPEEKTELHNDYSRGLQGHGSDPYYSVVPVKVSVPRWSRTCKKCGKKDYTYAEKVVKVDKAPDFGNR